MRMPIRLWTKPGPRTGTSSRLRPASSSAATNLRRSLSLQSKVGPAESQFIDGGTCQFDNYTRLFAVFSLYGCFGLIVLSLELIDFKTRRVAAFRKNLVELAELELKHAKVTTFCRNVHL